MINVYQLLELLFMFPFIWICSFLFHELFHIKANSLGDTGSIQVYKYGFTCYRDNRTNTDWFYLSGGLISGTLFIVLSFLVSDKVWFIGFFTAGMVNLVYSPFEMVFLPRWGAGDRRYKIGRYSLYLITIVVCLVCLLWWI